MDGYDRLRPSASRLEWIDAAKGLSIILVVFGHVFDPPIGNALSLLRMPFFFFLSGYVFKNRPTGTFLWRRVNSLIVPYVAYTIVLTLVWFAVTALSGASSTELILRTQETLSDLWLGGEMLPGYCAPLWFLVVLFVALLAYNQILAVFVSPASVGTAACVLAAVASAYALQDYRTFLGLGIAPMALAFVWAGSLYRVVSLPRWSVVLSLMLVAVAFHDTALFDFRTTEWGVPILSIAGAFAACHLAALACEALSNHAWFRVPLTRIGSGSLVIMALHVSIALKLRKISQLPPIFNLAVSIMVPLALFWQIRASNWITRWLLLGHVPSAKGMIQRVQTAP